MDSPKEVAEKWDKVAVAYQDSFMNLDLYNDTYDIFCKLVEKPEARIFEIGSGPGNISKYLLTKRPDFQIDGIDVSENMVKLANENNPKATFRTMDCRYLNYMSIRCDGILCGFCMPYLSKEDSAKLIKDCFPLLRNDGILYFSTIEGDYKKSAYERSSDRKHKMFVYNHEADYLQKHLDENNYETLHVIRKPYTKKDGKQETHIIFIAKKN